VVALHFNHAVLHRTARTTGRLELLAQRRESCRIQRHAFDQGDALAATAFGFTAHAHDTIACRRSGQRFADAIGHGLAAVGAHAATVGGVHQAAKGGKGFHAAHG